MKEEGEMVEFFLVPDRGLRREPMFGSQWNLQINIFKEDRKYLCQKIKIFFTIGEGYMSVSFPLKENCNITNLFAVSAFSPKIFYDKLLISALHVPLAE